MITMTPKAVTELAKLLTSRAKSSQAGLRLAERLGVRQSRRTSISDTHDVPAHWLEAQSQLRQRSQLGILSATALPPIGDLNAEQRTILLSLCAILGASTNLK